MDKQFENNVYGFVAELKHFDYSIESSDHIWDVIFPHKTARNIVYHYIRIAKYQGVFYIAHIDGKLCSLEVAENKSVKEAPSFGLSRESGDFTRGWNDLISSARSWLKLVKKDWIKASKQVWSSYPLNRRYGIVCNALVRESLPDIYQIGRKLGKAKVKKLSNWLKKERSGIIMRQLCLP